jgi:hypothetical protein
MESWTKTVNGMSNQQSARGMEEKESQVNSDDVGGDSLKTFQEGPRNNKISTLPQTLKWALSTRRTVHSQAWT